MNILSKIGGKILYWIATLISGILTGLIVILESIIGIISSIARGFLGLIGMGGCLLFFLFAGPFGLALLFNPSVLLTLLFFIIAPILGSKFVSYLKYLKYILTEYLFDRASYFMDGTSYQFESFDEYSNKYKRMEEEKRRKRQEQYRAEQQRQWEERFRQWSGNQQTYANPTSEFKSKYEKSCNLLGLSYDADEYQVKLAYRKKAKQYHPDINQSPNATEKFQQINDAYEFLSAGNIERYQKMA